jgi:hypothetical protein
MNYPLKISAVWTLVWPTRNMPSTTWLGPGNTALLGPEMRPETGLDVMEMVANSSSDRRQVGRQKDRQRSSVTHGSKPLAGIDGRSARVRRFESNISDLGGETLQCRQRHRLTCPCLNRPAGAADCRLEMIKRFGFVLPKAMLTQSIVACRP